MKDAQTILEKVQQFFVELVKEDQSFADAPTNVEAATEPVAVEVKLMDAKLKDGTMIQVTEMAVGGVVTIDGMPAPVGEHQLEDGTIIVVGDNGAIMEIKPAADQQAPEEVAPVMEDMSAKFAAFENATNEKFAAYEEKFAAYETKLTQANKVIEGLMQISKMLVEAPQGTPDASVKTSNAFAENNNDAKAAFEKFSNSICS